MSVDVKVTKDNVRDVLRAVSELARKDVLVGIPEEKTERRDQGAGQHLGNASIAYIQEHGSPVNNLPPRPFLAPGINSKREEIAVPLKAGAAAAIAGDVAGAERALHTAGLVAQNAARAQINSGNFTPLAESTLAARRRRGRKGTKPLIDTGQLRNSITYVIREK